MANPEIAILVSAKDQATGVIQKFNQSLKESKAEADKTKLAFDAMAKGAIGLSAVGAAGLAIVQSNQELNTSLSRTGVTLGLTRSQMQDLANTTADAGFPLKEVAATFDVLAKSGVTNTDMLQASASAFDSLADATGGSADALAATLIPGMKALGEQIPTTSAEMDKFTFLANQTSVTLEDFGSVMNYVALYGQDLNLTSKDIVATLAALEAKGISGSAATRDFRTAVKEAADESKVLADAVKNTEQAMKDVEDAQNAAADAAQTLEDAHAAATDAANSLADAQERAADAAKSLKEAQDDAGESLVRDHMALQRNSWAHDDLVKKLGKTKQGTREYQEVLLDIQDNELDRHDILDSMVDVQDKVTDAEENLTDANSALTKSQQESNDATEAVGKAYQESVAAQNKAKEAADKLTTAQGDQEKAAADAADTTGRLCDALGITKDELEAYKQKVDAAAGSTDTYKDAAEGNVTAMDGLKNKFGEAALKASEFLGPLEPLLIALTALAPVIMGIKLAQEAWTVAQAAFNVVMDANLIGLVCLAIAALIAIVVVIVKNWGPISEFFKKVWGAIQSAFETAINFIKGIVETVFNAVKGFIEAVWNGIKGFFETIWNAIVTVVETYINVYKTILETAWNVIKTVVETVWDAIKGVFETVFNAIKTVITTYINTYRTIIETAFNAIKTVIETVWNAIKTVVNTALSAINAAMSTAWNAIKTATTTTWNTIKGVFTTTWEAIKGVFTTALNALKTAMSTAWDAIKSNLTTAWNAIKGGFQTAWDGIKGVFSSAWEGIKTVWNSVGSFFSGIVSTIGNTFSGVIDKITGPFRTAFNSIKGIANAIIGGLNKIQFTVPDFPGVPHRGETIGINIPYLAKGGIITGPTMLSDLLTGRPLAVAGEAGPEYVVPQKALAVRPSSRGGGGDKVISITMPITLNVEHMWGDREGARKVVDWIMPELRDKQRLRLGKALY